VATQRSLRVQFDKGNSREETLLGKNYHVVPCIAMVQGVRFGAGQSDPELGLASEFGNNPIMWANRPLVLNHPKVGDTFVSANTPDILNKYQFGVTMNPVLDNDKLKLEAWIDKDRVDSTSDDEAFKSTFNRITAEEDVEVSVGFFTDVEKMKGQFNGQEYGGIWRNIRADHLAVLTEGLTGACSVADGCGVPRLNQSGDLKMPDLKLTGLMTGISGGQTQPQLQAAGCSCGGAHTQADHPDDNKPVTQGGLKKLLGDILKPFTQSPADKAVETHQEQRRLNEILVSQTINTTLMDKDIRAMISRALNARPNSGYVYLLGYTQDVAIYEDLDISNYTFKTYQLGINVTDAAVEFVGDPQEVLLQTKIVPQGATASTTTASETTTQETNMANEQQAAASADSKAQTAAATTEAAKPPVTQPQSVTVPVTAPEAPKVLTMEQYLSSLPPEMRENVTSALAAQEKKKTNLIKTLTDAKQNKFTEGYLKAQSVEILENMVALLPGTYAGVSQPTNTRFQAGGEEGKGETVPVPTINWNPKNHANGAA